MKKVVIVYGLISGAVAGALMLLTLPFMDKLEGASGYAVGYTAMILSGLLIFFGVRSYRENVGGGTISFGKGFQVGILIALISAVCYVGTWEFIYFKLEPDFCDKHFGAQVERLKASGAPPEKVAEAQQQLEMMKKLLANPVTNASLAFVEPLPVGLLISLISAWVLRRKPA
ncbi:MAG TPA: DUF4199 domain-containing protein [Candidatus Polarisedimenticolaceae bacterium]|nr:DUF4199 domain-containing protein [Candidatus Polarisedimenticolaceae bacterium]